MRAFALKTVRTFWRARDGLAAVEFALVLPVAVGILFGEFVLGEALSINRKVAIASRTVADLVARKSTVTGAELTDIMNASAQISAPFPSASMGVLVAELTTDATLVTKVTWHAASNSPGLTDGAVFTLPVGMAKANTALIYTKVTYSYTPPVGQNLFGTIPISNTFYMPPRISASVTKI
jgi:Flp pilus assembly protein TadG